MDHLNIQISTTLKNLRSKQGWSLSTASKITGVSKAMLGQIERGESSPTIATLWKIASGFDVPFSFFTSDLKHQKSNVSHCKKELQQDDTKIKVIPIFPFEEDLGFEVFLIELLPGYTHLSPPHQKGVIEHVVAIHGTIDLLIDQTWQNINQHEGLRFKADQPHGYRNLSDKPSLFHDIIHYRK